MSPRMTIALMGLGLVGGLLTAGKVQAEPAATLLEKGIYAEETKGDIAEALRFYLQITEQAATNRRVTAEAHYRIGMCLLKRGQSQEARQGFDNVILLYPEQKELVAKAKAQLAALGTPSGSGGGPVVVRTTPSPLANDVPASLRKLTVTFDQKMMDDSWSWTGGSDTFPKLTGKPSYDASRKTCSLPVELEPGKAYWVGINSPSHQNFQTPAHVPARPYVLLFATRGADGKPTAIPDEMIAKAKAINGTKAPASQPAGSNAMDLIDANTRAEIEKFEQMFAAWFQPEGKYEAASASEKEAMIEKWIAEAGSDDFKTRTRAIAALGNVAAEEAVDTLIKIAEEPMNNNRPKWMAVRGLGRIGDQKAVPTLIELIDYGNVNVKVYSRLALAQITGEYLGDSKDKWRQWWKQRGQRATGDERQAAESDRAKGWQLWSQGKHAQAEEMFKKATLADPGSANGWQGLGWTQFNQNQPLAAKASFEKCVAIEPTNAAALNGLGWIAKGEGKTDEAIGYWKKAIEAAPEATAALNGLATTATELGKHDEAIRYYEMMLKVMPANDQERKRVESALKKAKDAVDLKQISNAASDLKPAPWADGEVMPLRLSSAAGAEIGSMIYTANLSKANGKETWRIRSYMSISLQDMEQFTDVVAERDSFTPITGRTKNAAIGDFKAKYEPGKVTLEIAQKEGSKTKTFEPDNTVFDNEQALYLIRRLPLAEGYRGSFPIFPVIGGQIVECRITVLGKEQVTAPAGTYDCHKVSLEIYAGDVRGLQHQLWFSADEHKYLVKYDSGAVVMELQPVTVRKKGEPVVFKTDEPDLSVTLPEGWLFSRDPGETGYKLHVRLFAPELKPWAVFTGQPTEDDSVRKIAENDAESLKGFFTDYTIREASWTEHKVGTLPATSFIADYKDNGAKVEYRTYILGKGHVYWFVFRAAKDDFAKMEPTLDTIVSSLKVDEK